MVAEVTAGGQIWSLSRADFAAELARSGVARIADERNRTAVATRIADRTVDEQLLYFAAQAANVTVADKELSREVEHAMEGYPPGVFQRTLHAEKMTVNDYRAAVQRRLTIRRFIRNELNKIPAVTAEEAQARYRSQLAGTDQPPEVRVRQVLVPTKEEADFIRGEIAAGRLTMEAAARRFSKAPDGQAGGDLGWFKKGDMPPVFDVCFRMKRGELSRVVKSPWDFHLFEVIDTRPGRKMSFVAAEERLYDELRRERQTAGRDELVKRLRKEATVAVYEGAIKSAVDALGPPPKMEEQALPLEPKAKPTPGVTGPAPGQPTGQPPSALPEVSP